MRVRDRVVLFIWTKMPSYVATVLIQCVRLFRKNLHSSESPSTPARERESGEPRLRHPPRVKIYWWRPVFGGFTNFGDELGPLILERLFGFTYRWAPPEACDIVVMGSVLEKVCAARREAPPIVWGAGFIGEGSAVSQRTVTAAAVRGRLSAKRFGMENTLVTGDPGLLCSELLDRMPNKQYQVGVVLHHTHKKVDVTSLFAGDIRRIRTIDVRMPPLQVIQEIAACETILSSSLHGLVVADSLGIPNQWITFPQRLFGGDYKFHDYYSAVCCDTPQPHVVNHRRRFDYRTIAQIGEHYERPGLESIRNKLLSCFPKSLLEAQCMRS